MSESLKDSEKLSFYENLSLSGAAAIISKTAAAPIERLKLNMQNQQEMLKQGSIDRPYRGIFDCATRVTTTEGYLALWRGNGANVLRYFPTQALNFAFLGKIKEYFRPEKDDSYKVQLAKNITAGGVAGSMSLSVVYSLDYARTRLANDAKASKKAGATRQFAGIFDVYRKTYASDGVNGLYRGFMVSCVGIFVYRGLYFGLYDTIKPAVGKKNFNVIVSFLVAYMITVFAGLVSYPIDTVRRRMMMTSGASVKYSSSFDCARQILANEGVPSFFKGAGANILRGVAGALVISGFDLLRSVYIEHFKNEGRHI